MKIFDAFVHTGNPDFGLDFWYQNVAQWGYGDRYSTDVYVEQTKNFLDEHDNKDPFFLYLAFQAPHFPLQVPGKYTKNCKQKTEDRRLLCGTDIFSSCMSWQWEISSFDYLGMVNAVDSAIDEIVQYLKSKDLYDNTIIIFSSDVIYRSRKNNSATNCRFRMEALLTLEVTTGHCEEPSSHCGKEVRERTRSYIRLSTCNNTPSEKSSFYRRAQSPHPLFFRLFHVVDWYATILGMVGEDDIDVYGDGFNQWEMITKGTKGKRHSLVYNYPRPELGTDIFSGGGGAAIRFAPYCSTERLTTNLEWADTN
jgi:hypothetical protein